MKLITSKFVDNQSSLKVSLLKKRKTSDNDDSDHGNSSDDFDNNDDSDDDDNCDNNDDVDDGDDRDKNDYSDNNDDNDGDHTIAGKIKINKNKNNKKINKKSLTRKKSTVKQSSISTKAIKFINKKRKRNNNYDNSNNNDDSHDGDSNDDSDNIDKDKKSLIIKKSKIKPSSRSTKTKKTNSNIIKAKRKSNQTANVINDNNDDFIQVDENIVINEIKKSFFCYVFETEMGKLNNHGNNLIKKTFTSLFAQINYESKNDEFLNIKRYFFEVFENDNQKNNINHLSEIIKKKILYGDDFPAISKTNVFSIYLLNNDSTSQNNNDDSLQDLFMILENSTESVFDQFGCFDVDCIQCLTRLNQKLIVNSDNNEKNNKIDFNESDELKCLFEKKCIAKKSSKTILDIIIYFCCHHDVDKTLLIFENTKSDVKSGWCYMLLKKMFFSSKFIEDKFSMSTILNFVSDCKSRNANNYAILIFDEEADTLRFSDEFDVNGICNQIDICFDQFIDSFITEYHYKSNAFDYVLDCKLNQKKVQQIYVDEIKAFVKDEIIDQSTKDNLIKMVDRIGDVNVNFNKYFEVC
jgi:hypothetical protein